MRFSEWLFLEELSFERSIDTILEPAAKYWPPDRDHYAELKKQILPQKDIVLKTIQNNPTPEKRKTAFLDFIIGMLAIKPDALPEDIQFAWDSYDHFLKNRGTYIERMPELASMKPANLGMKLPELNAIRVDLETKKNKSMREKRLGKLLPGQKTQIVYDGNVQNNIGDTIHYTVYKIPALSAEDSSDPKKIDAQHVQMCHLGKGTRWCTAHPTGDYYKNYIRDDIYVIHRNGKPQYQLNVRNGDVDQFMDVNDDPVMSPDNVFTYSKYLYRILFSKLDINMSSPKERYKEKNVLQYTVYEDYDSNLKTDDALAKMFPDDITGSVLDYLGGRRASPALESVIANNPSKALQYARVILKGRMPPEMEDKVFNEKNAYWANYLYQYAEQLKGLPPELERKLIEARPEAAYQYAVHIIKKPLSPELELLAFQGPTMIKHAINYAYIFKKKLPPQIEEILDKHTNGGFSKGRETLNQL